MLKTILTARTTAPRSARPAVAVLLSLGLLGSASLAQELPVDNRVMMRVNDRIVTKVTFERQLAAAMADLTRRDLDPEELNQRREELPRQVLRGLWDELLVLSRGDQMGITVTDFEVEEMVAGQMEQFGMEDEEQLAAALAQSGISPTQFRDNLRGGLLQRKVMSRELFPRVELEEDELRRVYRENQDDYRVPESRALHELVVLEGEAGSDLDEVAIRVAAAWSRNEPVEDIVEREGEFVRFIDLGTVVREELASTLADVAFSMPEGQVSEPVVARGGLHIVKVVDIEPARVLPFEEVREQVSQDERMRRMEEEREVYLRELEESAYYELNLPPELSTFRTSTGFEPGAGGLGDVSTSPLGLEISSPEEVEAARSGEDETSSDDGAPGR